MRELQYLRDVIRFVGTFAATILIPAVLLSYFALASSRTEELTVDADLRAHGDVVTKQVISDVNNAFWRFEHAVRLRLRDRRSPVSELSQLSPYLHAAFQFDENGTLIAPFDLPDDQVPPKDTIAFSRTFRQAQQAEQSGQYEEALQSYLQAEQFALDDILGGEARFAYARMLDRTGQTDEALVELSRFDNNYSDVRDRRGFRLTDLAALKRAEITFKQDEPKGIEELIELTETLLSHRWSVGMPGETAVARRAMALLEGKVKEQWIIDNTQLLDRRSEQLHWAGNVADELELFGSTHGQATTQFRYYARNESPSVWATAKFNENLYAFSLSSSDLILDLQLELNRINATNDDLSVQLRCGFPPKVCRDTIALAGTDSMLLGPGAG
ncbi:MAG: hypothetical protein HN348_31215, partial [Proteobacteria bacterium]|nr:hypothetical protein [Pseudomonadota bacterium]